MRSRHRLELSSTLAVTAVLVAVLAGTVRADVNLCLNCCGNSTLVYQCYETDLSCDDISLGPIIRECEQLSVAGPAGSGVTGGIHPDVDGQSLLGQVSYDGAANGPTGALSDFVVLWESRETFLPGKRAQVVASDATGALYWAEFDVAGIERRAVGDLVITGTPAGQEVAGTLDLVPTGRIAGGDMTITVSVYPVNDPPVAKAAPLEVYHTDIVFDELEWELLSQEPVGSDGLDWGTVKATY